MRVRPTSADTCAKHAKTLKRALQGLGVETTLSAAQNTLGSMYGYRNWHEMVLAVRGPGRPSPEDEDVSPEEAAARRSRQAQVLVDVYDLGPATALKVVEAIRPTARNRPRQVSDPIVYAERSWRRLLRERRNRHGFLSYDRQEWGRPASEPLVSFPLEGSNVTVRAWVRQKVPSNWPGAVAVRVTAAALDGDTLVGILDGLGACVADEDTEPSRPLGIRHRGLNALLSAIGSEFTVPEAARVQAALDLVSMRIGRNGAHQEDGIIRVKDWETLPEKAPKGCGVALMAAADAAILKAGLRHGGFLLDLLPRQFHDIPHQERLGRLDFRAARTNLEDYLVTAFDRTPWRHPGLIVHEHPMSLEGKPTETVAGEPRPWTDGMFPKDFDLDAVLEGSRGRKVSVHSHFWMSMPNDLRAVSVQYREERLGDGGAPVSREHILDFHFANGCVLRVPMREIEGFMGHPFVPKSLTVDGRNPLPVNPFTDRMTVEDMYVALASNVWMLFARRGDEEASGRGRITVWRPGY